jgi:hypothetical protein
VTDSPIRRLIDASSLGTPDARALRDSVSDETARQIVARAEQLADEWAAEAAWNRQATSTPSTPTTAP